MIAFTTRVSVPTHVLMRDIGGESVILNLNSERYLGLDDVGTRMLAVLSSSESIEKAYEVLLAEYDVDGELLRSDLQDLIEKLLENGLVEIGERGESL